jgi:hypothetical protein
MNNIQQVNPFSLPYLLGDEFLAKNRDWCRFPD